MPSVKWPDPSYNGESTKAGTKYHPPARLGKMVFSPTMRYAYSKASPFAGSRLFPVRVVFRHGMRQEHGRGVWRSEEWGGGGE